MNRHRFFRSGLKEIFAHLWKSPVGQLMSRQLQSLANLLAPQGLDYYVSQSTSSAKILDPARHNSKASRVRESKGNSLFFPRPPGSLPIEKDFDKACTRCGDCRAACPHGAIQGDENTGPFLDPNILACHLCVDYPCIECLPRRGLAALGSLLSAQAGPGPAISRICVLIRKQPKSCDICQRSCPVPAAIKYDLQGLPEFTDYCTGCGLCRAACPTIPVAIEMSSESIASMSFLCLS